VIRRFFLLRFTVFCDTLDLTGAGKAAIRLADEKQQQDKELDFDAVLADLHRQAHDKELEALASLTLLRSSWGNDEAMSPNDQKQKSLDDRLKEILGDIDKD